jgi:acyl carrier protein
VALKTLEGGLQAIVAELLEAFDSTDEARAASRRLMPALGQVYAVLDPESAGGAMLLGVDGICIISHGSSSARAIVNAIRVANEMVTGGVVGHISQAVGIERRVRGEQRRSVETGGTDTFGSDDAPDFLAELASLDVELRSARLAAEIRAQALKVLGLDDGCPLDSSQGFTDLGMDSLMAVELSDRLALLVDRTLPSTLVFEQPTVDLMTVHIRELLADRVGFGPPPGEAIRRSESTVDVEQISAMTDDEVAARLLLALEESGY